jgi:hypothetical protein
MTGPRINGNALPGAERGKYAELIDAVSAMHAGDCLRWDCPKQKFESVRTRLTKLFEGQLWIHWHGERIWIVRYEAPK